MVAPRVVTFNILIPVFIFKCQVLQQKSMINLNKTTLVAANCFKNRPLFTDLYIQVQLLIKMTLCCLINRQLVNRQLVNLNNMPMVGKPAS